MEAKANFILRQSSGTILDGKKKFSYTYENISSELEHENKNNVHLVCTKHGEIIFPGENYQVIEANEMSIKINEIHLDYKKYEEIHEFTLDVSDWIDGTFTLKALGNILEIGGYEKEDKFVGLSMEIPNRVKDKIKYNEVDGIIVIGVPFNDF